MNQKRKNRPSRHLKPGGEAPSAVAMLLLCLFLIGAGIGCYVAKGTASLLESSGKWVLLTACADGAAMVFSILIVRRRAYPLFPALVLIGKGVLTSSWIIWQCQESTVAEYLRCCGRCALLIGISLGALLIVFLHGFSLRSRPGRREESRQATVCLLGAMFLILALAGLAQWWICKVL